MPKLLFALSDSNLGGAGRSVLALLSQLDRSVYEVSVALPAHAALCRPLAQMKVPMFWMHAGADRSASVASVIEYRRLFAKETFDILHTHAALGALLAAYGKIPRRVATRHCEGVLSAGRLGHHLPGMRSVEWIAVSEGCRRALLTEGVSPCRVHWIPNGAREPRRLSDAAKAVVRKSLGIPQNGKVIGWFGRLEPVKGADLLIPVLADVMRQMPDVYAVVCGSGTLLSATQAAQISLPRLRCLGMQTEIDPYLSICDCVLNLSRSEASPLAVMEAMLGGICVCATDIPGNRATLADTGWYVPADREAEAAERLRVLLGTPDLRRCLADAAYARAASRFSLAGMVQKTEQIYEKNPLWEVPVRVGHL